MKLSRIPVLTAMILALLVGGITSSLFWPVPVEIRQVMVTQQEMIALAMKSVVHIRAGDEFDGLQGSGVYVGNGLIMTARHIVKEWTEFKVTFENGTEYTSDWAITESTSDVGFIHIGGLPLCEPLKLNAHKLVRGDTVFILGNPFGLTFKFSATKGMVSAIDRDAEGFFGEKLIFQTDAAAYPGNSGGPVLNEFGEIVGIIVGIHSGADNLSLCIPAEICENALETCLSILEMRELK